MKKNQSIYQEFAKNNKSSISIAKSGIAYIVTNHIAGVSIDTWMVVVVSANRSSISFRTFVSRRYANNYVREQLNLNGGADPVHEDVNDLPF
ncbi:MAG: hypothetical protein ACJ8BW_40580 [Ktedonobacteraceae bacterium]